ncbi:MAG TPA: hypothetical protein VNC84_07265 [Gammaproteobacteria bacterium]|jgi:hypothetical protein|nr:hypothetical protein [Gammaproteobacteria bacterium]
MKGRTEGDKQDIFKNRNILSGNLRTMQAAVVREPVSVDIGDGMGPIDTTVVTYDPYSGVYPFLSRMQDKMMLQESTGDPGTLSPSLQKKYEKYATLSTNLIACVDNKRIFDDNIKALSNSYNPICSQIAKELNKASRGRDKVVATSSSAAGSEIRFYKHAADYTTALRKVMESPPNMDRKKKNELLDKLQEESVKLSNYGKQERLISRAVKSGIASSTTLAGIGGGLIALALVSGPPGWIAAAAAGVVAGVALVGLAGYKAAAKAGYVPGHDKSRLAKIDDKFTKELIKEEKGDGLVAVAQSEEKKWQDMTKEEFLGKDDITKGKIICDMLKEMPSWKDKDVNASSFDNVFRPSSRSLFEKGKPNDDVFETIGINANMYFREKGNETSWDQLVKCSAKQNSALAGEAGMGGASPENTNDTPRPGR